MNLKDLIKNAGLMVDEFAALGGISRATVHSWMRGSPINPLRKPRIDKLTAAVESAVLAGDLPFGEKRPRRHGTEDVRMESIKKIVIKHLASAQKTV